MANIMLTDVCNLKCPYCFANEFVNKDKSEISLENFKEACDFILKDGITKEIGLIGGEPTIHSKFKEILKLIINDQRIQNAMIYTNGILCDKYINEISHPKFNFLINCNSPQDIGIKYFEKLCGNLDLLINQRYFKDRITLGINFYKPNQDYKYILDLLIKYNFNRVRMSISVPNIDDNKNRNAHIYFLEMKQVIKNFFRDCLENNILPFYDCNKMPSCLISDEEFNEFSLLLKEYPKQELIRDNSIATDIVKCSPVVDIRQDLTAVRCFGLSDVSKVSILEFNNLQELKNYYINEFDSYSFSTAYTRKCVDCYRRKTLKCTGGCMAFKIKDIEELKKIHYFSMKNKEI